MNMRKIVIRLGSLMIAALLLGAALLGSQQAAQATGSCSWALENSADVANIDNYLYGVTVLSNSNVWAVGQTINAGNNTKNPLIENYDGSSWTIATVPTPGTAHYLYGVAASGASDVWAVGQYYDATDSRDEPLVLRYNGMSWSQVTPSLSYAGYLYGVTVVSSSQVWMVGKYIDAGATKPLILQWDGSSWTHHVGFNMPTAGIFYSVSWATTSGTTRISAVGSFNSGVFVRETEDGGSNWTSPNVGSGGNNAIRGVARATRDKGLAVGNDGVDFAHWLQNTGSTNWTRSTHAVADERYLYGIALRSYAAVGDTADFWAVGHSYNPAGGVGTDRMALVLRRDGSFGSASWVADSPAQVGSYDNYLYGVGTNSTSNVFAVGYYYDGANYQTLIHSCTP